MISPSATSTSSAQETSRNPPSLLSIPQEIRDHIYSYLFLSATATTEHPFPECIPARRRFFTYADTSLVSRALYRDVKAYFTKHIVPSATFYFTDPEDLRIWQSKASKHPILKHFNFHIRCGIGTYNHDHPAWKSPCGRPIAPRQTQDAEALIRIQPGFEWWMDELPGFYRTKPAVQTNYGYYPATGPKAWKPREHGTVVLEQTGGELCDSSTCLQRRRGSGDMLEVTEVHYPPLRQGQETINSILGPSAAMLSSKGSLRLSCYIWPVDPQHWASRHRSEVSVMVLEGKLMDVWVPENLVELYLKRRKDRMV